MDGSTSRDLRPQDTVPLAIAGEPPKPSLATPRLRVQGTVDWPLQECSHELPSTRADAKAHRQDSGGCLNMATN